MTELNIADAFLTALFSRKPLGKSYLGFIEIRSIYPVAMRSTEEEAIRVKPITVNYCASITEAASTARQQNELGYDTYFGVLPRATKRGSSDSVAIAGTLWADYDFKDGRSESTLKEALHKLPSYLRRPSVEVNSGNGRHLYWLLDSVVSKATAVFNNRSIAEVIGADATFDAARILRVPGTTNRKPLVMKEVEVIEFDTGYPVDATLLLEPPASELHRKTYSGGRNTLDPPTDCYVDLSRLPSVWRNYINKGIDGDLHNFYKGDRSRLDFNVIYQMRLHGYSDGEIIGVFCTPKNGISRKSLEMPPGQRATYLYRTIDKVTDQVENKLAEEKAYHESC